MTRFTLIIFILISILAGSCSGRKNKLDDSNLIPDKDLVSILTDAYIADGLLTLPKIHSVFSSLDSLTTYMQIIEKHGYSKEIMDKTMKYYFINDPGRLIKIYDKALATLSERESLAEKAASLEIERISNLWSGNKTYFFPDSTVTDSATFDIPLDRTGSYTLSFSATFFPDDQSINPRTTLYSYVPDSINTVKKEFIKTMNYIKDGRPHTYFFTIKTLEKTTLHLRGFLYDFDNNPAECEKHAEFENISVTYILSMV